jgi:hypothetical protein
VSIAEANGIEAAPYREVFASRQRDTEFVIFWSPESTKEAAMRKVQAERGHIYGEVNSIKDIRELNGTIRREMDRVKTREQLTELKKRSDYLCTLTFSPAWKTKFGEKVNRLREVAMEENRKTVQHANEVARRHGWPANYDPWGED